MVHAGIPPIWTLKQACLYASKLEKALQGENYQEFLQFLFKSDSINSMEEAYTRRAKLKLTAAYLTQMSERLVASLDITYGVHGH